MVPHNRVPALNLCSCGRNVVVLLLLRTTSRGTLLTQGPPFAEGSDASYVAVTAPGLVAGRSILLVRTQHAHD